MIDKIKNIFSRKKTPQELHREATGRKLTESLKAPEQVIIPMKMHEGRACDCLVKAGDYVKIGQIIGASCDPNAVPVHSTVSGIVKAVEKMNIGYDIDVLCAVIDNDGKNTACALIPHDDWESMSFEELIDIIREAGIAGHGTDERPPHVKIHDALGKTRMLIINGEENAMYESSTYRIMIENPDKLIGGIRILLRIFPKAKCCITLSRESREAEGVLNRVIGSDSRIKVKLMNPRYIPLSDSQLIKAVTDVEESKCLVMNAETAMNIYRAVAEGRQMLTKIVTVSGSAITRPKNLKVRIGTPLKYLIKSAEGFKEEPSRIIIGDPMTGIEQTSLEIPVTKSTNSLIAILDGEQRENRDAKCIRCGRCVSVCPSKLMPLYIYENALKANYKKCASLGVSDCIECGACTFECPAEIDLTGVFREVKSKIQ